MKKLYDKNEPIMHERIERVHFIGIGGVGMCGLAEILLNQGYQVSGSDRADSAAIKRLRELGASVSVGHSAEHIHVADVVVKSSAVADDNVELQTALAKNIPVILRGEMLAELVRQHYTIAIAGTHGKTTTTSLTTSVLIEAGMDPMFVIGGKLNSAGVNARLGSSHYAVVEADESDASFLYLQPTIAVIGNIEADHLETYGNDFSQLEAAFIKFSKQLPFYGLGVVCIDDPIVKKLLPDIKRSVLTYGFSEGADIQALNLEEDGLYSIFTVKRSANRTELKVKLNMPGRHNVLNALAAIVVATELDVADDAICNALENFSGVGRRLQIHGELDFNHKKILLVDDYGHHPTAVSATIKAAKQAWPDRRVLFAFQPHRYSRVQALFDEFAQALSASDALLVLDIYSAGEAVIPGVDSQALCQRIVECQGVKPIYVGAEENLPAALADVAQENDVLLMQGAGSIGKLALEMAERYKILKI
ncbi:MAG: UDP-N-acetylmuramate--L-alanine ligase [Gammaproteobacteria bacterium]